MGFYGEQILPRVTDRALRGQEAARLRARVTAGLSGEVLEVGFGSGLNMPFYPAAVKRVRAVDPSAVARKLAADRVAASTVPVEYIGADAQALKLADASVDHVVSVLTLCTIPAVDRALAEIRRVIKPDGQYLFLEHVRSADPKVAHSQDRWEGVWGVIAQGCHPNRDTFPRIESAFTIDQVERSEVPFGPKIVRPYVLGRAIAG